MLIPRMTLAQKNTITTPATGLLIYQTDAITGFWFFNGVTWEQLNSAGWSINGNSGTNSTTNKAGTTDGQDLSIVTNVSYPKTRPIKNRIRQGVYPRVQ